MVSLSETSKSFVSTSGDIPINIGNMLTFIIRNVFPGKACAIERGLLSLR